MTEHFIEIRAAKEAPLDLSTVKALKIHGQEVVMHEIARRISIQELQREIAKAVPYVEQILAAIHDKEDVSGRTIDAVHSFWADQQQEIGKYDFSNTAQIFGVHPGILYSYIGSLYREGQLAEQSDTLAYHMYIGSTPQSDMIMEAYQEKYGTP